MHACANRPTQTNHIHEGETPQQFKEGISKKKNKEVVEAVPFLVSLQHTFSQSPETTPHSLTECTYH